MVWVKIRFVYQQYSIANVLQFYWRSRTQPNTSTSRVNIAAKSVSQDRWSMLIQSFSWQIRFWLNFEWLQNRQFFGLMKLLEGWMFISFLLSVAILLDIFMVILSRSHEHERVQGALLLRQMCFHSKTTVPLKPLGRHHRVMNSPVSSGLGNSHHLQQKNRDGRMPWIHMSNRLYLRKKETA